MSDLSAPSTRPDSEQPRRGRGRFFDRIANVFGWLTFVSLLGGVLYLFYFHGYRFFIANSSASSTAELVRRKLLVASDVQTIVLGNSTAAMGFPATVYNHLPGKSVPALNLGIPSGHMLLYEKVLNMALAAGLHPKAVVLIVTPDILRFSANPYFDYLKNDEGILKVELQWRDLLLLGNHSRSLLHEIDYAAPMIFRPALFSADLRDFFSHPGQRVKDAVFVQNWMDSLKAPESFPEPENHFSVCQADPLDTLGDRLQSDPALAQSPVRGDLERTWAGYRDRANSRDSMKVDEFEQARLAALLGRFADKAPHVFLVEAPYFDPQFTQVPADYRSSLAEALRAISDDARNIHLLADFPVNCSLMMDTVHLNRQGAEAFTAYLHGEVEAVLSGTAKND